MVIFLFSRIVLIRGNGVYPRTQFGNTQQSPSATVAAHICKDAVQISERLVMLLRLETNPM